MCPFAMMHAVAAVVAKTECADDRCKSRMHFKRCLLLSSSGVKSMFLDPQSISMVHL